MSLCPNLYSCNISALTGLRPSFYMLLEVDCRKASENDWQSVLFMILFI